MTRNSIIITPHEVLAESRNMKWTKRVLRTGETSTYTKMMLEI
jgi:D-ribose pyranose/furanose isomerase RbsD